MSYIEQHDAEHITELERENAALREEIGPLRYLKNNVGRLVAPLGAAWAELGCPSELLRRYASACDAKIVGLERENAALVKAVLSAQESCDLGTSALARADGLEFDWLSWVEAVELCRKGGQG